MEDKLKFIRDLALLIIIPFMDFSMKALNLSLSLFVLNLFFQIAVSTKYLSKFHEYIKFPSTLILGIGMMQWFVFIDNIYIFAFALIAFFLILRLSSFEERVQHNVLLGPRYSLYSSWVGDFLPGWIPVSKLPKLDFKLKSGKKFFNNFHWSSVSLVFVSIICVFKPEYALGFRLAFLIINFTLLGFMHRALIHQFNYNRW